MGKLIVKKFGGTSVADAERIEAVADNVEAEIQKGNKVTVVLSAMGKSTDDLIDLAKEINPEPDLREYDALVSTGEQISVALLAMALNLLINSRREVSTIISFKYLDINNFSSFTVRHSRHIWGQILP